jgi:hypothetical protein
MTTPLKILRLSLYRCVFSFNAFIVIYCGVFILFMLFTFIHLSFYYYYCVYFILLDWICMHIIFWFFTNFIKTQVKTLYLSLSLLVLDREFRWRVWFMSIDYHLYFTSNENSPYAWGIIKLLHYSCCMRLRGWARPYTS